MHRAWGHRIEKTGCLVPFQKSRQWKARRPGRPAHTCVCQSPSTSDTSGAAWLCAWLHCRKGTSPADTPQPQYSLASQGSGAKSMPRPGSNPSLVTLGKPRLLLGLQPFTCKMGGLDVVYLRAPQLYLSKILHPNNPVSPGT